MNKKEELIILKEIKEILKLNNEQRKMIYRNLLFLYIRSIKVFGIKSEVSKDILKMYLEIKNILNTEKKLLVRLSDSTDNIEFNDSIRFLNELDDINAITIQYYYDLIDDKEIAIVLNNEDKAIRRKRKFKTINELNI